MSAGEDFGSAAAMAPLPPNACSIYRSRIITCWSAPISSKTLASRSKYSSRVSMKARHREPKRPPTDAALLREFVDLAGFEFDLSEQSSLPNGGQHLRCPAVRDCGEYQGQRLIRLR
jgi:hypothetical protein